MTDRERDGGAEASVDRARTATEISHAVRSGCLTATEIVDAGLRRIDAENPRLNALAVVFAERARREAERIDRVVADGGDPGVLAGVPFSVKENIDLTWSATTEGWRGAEHAVPERDATIVARMRAAGAIPIGRGNMPDFGMRWDTDNDLFGRTLNPWDASRTTFGSSGGDAVAVATGMSAIGLGNDFGGSLRLPASAAGIVGLRPSLGRVPRAAVNGPVAPTLQRFAVNGPLGRTVADVELVLRAIAGPDVADPVSLPLSPPTAYEGARRVAVVRDPAGWGISSDASAGIDRAAAALAEAGWDVADVEPPDIAEAAQLWRRLACTDMAWTLDTERLPMPLGRAATAFLRDSTAAAGVYETAAEYAQAWARRAEIEAEWRRFQREWPVVLGPVFTGDLPPVDFDLGSPAAADAAWRGLCLVVVANLLGLPAVSVPVGHGMGGLPVSAQLIGPAHVDAAVLAAAHDVERAIGLTSQTARDASPRPRPSMGSA